MRDAGDIVLFSCASASEAPVRGAEQGEKYLWHFEALRATLIEIVDDVPGAG